MSATSIVRDNNISEKSTYNAMVKMTSTEASNEYVVVYSYSQLLMTRDHEERPIHKGRNTFLRESRVTTANGKELMEMNSWLSNFWNRLNADEKITLNKDNTADLENTSFFKSNYPSQHSPSGKSPGYVFYEPTLPLQLDKPFGPRLLNFSPSSDPPNPLVETCVGSALSGYVAGFGIGMALVVMSEAVAPSQQSFHDAVAQNKSTWEQVKAGYKGLPKRMTNLGKSFGKVASIYGFSLCWIEKYRGKEDIWNHAISGCSTGAAVALKNGPQAALMGCGSFATFSLVVENYLNWSATRSVEL